MNAIPDHHINPISVVVVDDDRLAANALVQILTSDGQFTVLAAGHSEAEAVTLYEQHRPDVLLLDIRMGEGSGIKAASRVLAFDPAAKVLFLSTFLDRSYLVDAVKLGAKGYILKQDYESLIPALISVANGHRVFADAVAGELSHVVSAHSEETLTRLADAGLSEREIEIVVKVAEGCSNREVANALYLSEGTVRNHISQILAKLELRDRTQLVVFFYRQLGPDQTP